MWALEAVDNATNVEQLIIVLIHQEVGKAVPAFLF